MNNENTYIDASIIVSASEMTLQPVSIRAENGKLVLEMPPDCRLKQVYIELSPEKGLEMIEAIHDARWWQQNHD